MLPPCRDCDGYFDDPEPLREPLKKDDWLGNLQRAKTTVRDAGGEVEKVQSLLYAVGLDRLAARLDRVYANLLSAEEMIATGTDTVLSQNLRHS